MAATADFRRANAFSPKAEDVIAPEPAARVRHFRPAFPSGTIIDAEYEEITAVEMPRHTTDSRDPQPAGQARHKARYDGEAGCLDLFGRSLKLTTAASKKSGFAGFAAATVALSVVSFWISGGHAAVTRLLAERPAAGRLAIADVSTRLGLVDGMSVAIVDGIIRNDTAEPQAVPAIAIRMAAAGAVPPVRAQAVDAMLDPGQSTGFRARLPVPEGSDAAVTVAFEERTSQ